MAGRDPLTITGGQRGVAPTARAAFRTCPSGSSASPRTASRSSGNPERLARSHAHARCRGSGSLRHISTSVGHQSDAVRLCRMNAASRRTPSSGSPRWTSMTGAVHSAIQSASIALSAAPRVATWGAWRSASTTGRSSVSVEAAIAEQAACTTYDDGSCSAARSRAVARAAAGRCCPSDSIAARRTVQSRDAASSVSASCASSKGDRPSAAIDRHRSDPSPRAAARRSVSLERAAASSPATGSRCRAGASGSP